MTRAKPLIVTVAILAVLVGLTFALDPFRNYQLATVAAYLCAVAGLTVLTGVSGQLSLGHGALMAGGAYSYALTANALAEAEIEGFVLFIVPLLAAVAGAALLGLVVGLAAARLHGPYLAGVTLALVIALPAVTSSLSGVLGGDQGLWITVEGRPDAVRATIGNEQWQALFAIVCAVIVMVLLRNLLRGRFGRELRAVRDNEVAAALNGISVSRAKVTAFIVSSAAAGVGGGLLAYISQAASPGAYSLAFSLFLLMAAVVGGIGSLAGAVWGAILLVLLPDVIGTLTAGLSLPAEVAQRLDGNLAIAIFGAVLVLVVVLAPRGIQGLISGTGNRIRTRLQSRQAQTQSSTLTR